MKQKLGIALVGLGKYSTEELAPALEKTKYCKLAGIVTGEQEKAKKWKEKYSIPDSNIYSYETFHTIKDNSTIDIVYVVLPNSLHAEYVVMSARAGKHVISEKPMDISVQKCAEMISACEKAGRLLSIGYRLHFDPYHRVMMNLRRNNKYGKLKKIIAAHGMKVPENVWRIDKLLAGGGPLMDVGIYCVQAAMYITGEQPIAVSAIEGEKKNTQKFKNVEESLTWTMEFQDGVIAECSTSYSEEQDLLRAEFEHGWVELEPAFAYRDLSASTSDGKMEFPEVNQQALQMDDFAICIRENRKSKVSGDMGLRDVKIMLSIYEAMITGRRIVITAA